MSAGRAAVDAGAPALTLRAGAHVLKLGGRPWLMGIVNCSPDSFSDGTRSGVEGRVRQGAALLDAGAQILDVGGESAITGRNPVAEDVEIARVVPVIARLTAELGALVSVDTYKPAVARAAVAAGASIINDVSGLRDLALAAICAQSGAALVIMHTRAAPKTRRQDPRLYSDVTADVVALLHERVDAAMHAGVAEEHVLLDPGPDFAKTPAQTVALLTRLPELHSLGRPLLLAVSRKDFIGALTGRPPAQRGAGTLAAVAHGADCGVHMVRVHDVRAAAEYLTVRAALRGEVPIASELALAEELRHQSSA